MAPKQFTFKEAEETKDLKKRLEEGVLQSEYREFVRILPYFPLHFYI
jgi:hypothetical protein